MDFIPLQLIFGLVVGLIARSKGRSGLGWGLFGVFLHVVALVIVVVVPNLNDPETRRRRAERAWKKERLSNEPWRADQPQPEPRPDPLPRTWGPIDEPQGPAPQAMWSNGLPPRLPQQPAPLGDERAWYFEEQGRAQGPEPESSVRRRLVQGELAPDTLVWAAGMDEWTPADTRAEFLA